MIAPMLCTRPAFLARPALLATIVLSLTPPLGAAQPPRANLPTLTDLRDLEAVFAEVARDTAPAVVAIRAFCRPLDPSLLEDPPATASASLSDSELLPTTSTGSGVIIRDDGMILTNAHVIEDCEQIRVWLYDGRWADALLVGVDDRSDLAVVKINAGPLPTAVLGDVAHCQVGQWALALGDPFGLSLNGRPSLSVGTISALGRVLQQELDPTEARYYGNLIQTTAAISPGNSGGPLLNLDGEVIGINTAVQVRRVGGYNLGFAIPISQRTRTVINRLLAGEPVEYGYLGARVRDPGSEERAAYALAGGALVEWLAPGGPAEGAGIQPGDIVARVGEAPVRSADHLVRLIGALAPGTTVPLAVIRGGQQHILSVRLGRRATRLPPAAGRHHVLRWAGMTLAEPASHTAMADGLRVITVTPDSPAEALGIVPGACITAAEGTPVRTVARLRDIIMGAGQRIELTLADGRTVTLPVTSRRP